MADSFETCGKVIGVSINYSEDEECYHKNLIDVIVIAFEHNNLTYIYRQQLSRLINLLC